MKPMQLSEELEAVVGKGPYASLRGGKALVGIH